MLRVGALPSLRRPDVDTFIAEQREIAKALAEMAETTEWEDIANLPENSALHRAGATVMRRNGFSEEEIVEKFGYSPDSIE